MTHAHRLAAAALLALAPLTARAEEASTVALLPLENLSAAEDGGRQLAPLVARRLAGKGWRVVSGEDVEQALDEARVRYLDSLPAAAREKVLSRLHAGAIATGTLYAYEAGERPLVALALRIESADGTPLFSELAALTSEDAERLFEFGRKASRDELTVEALDRLTARLPAPGSAAPARRRGKPFGLSAPATYRSEALAARPGGAARRVIVLPLANAAFERSAGRVAAGLLCRRLAGSALLTPVAAGDFRDAFVADQIRDLTDPAELARLGARLGTTLFVSGTVYEYAEAPRTGLGTPRFEVALALTDVARGEVLWTSFGSRKGSDYRGLLELGAITNVVGLADQVLSEMVRAAETTRPRPGAPPSSATRGTAPRSTGSPTGVTRP